MYCSNCGEKITKTASFCPKCGNKVNGVAEVPVTPAVEKPKRGKGIASMILGILAVIYSISALGVCSELDNYLEGESVAFQNGFAFGVVLVQLVLAIVGISLACVERRDNKNGFNTAGLALTLVAFIFIVCEFIYVITY